ncbi:MAG: hypothetical protein V2J02_07975, partial [Pseudomonadales bacterium]|nr:hypothetical protein [Pseudomonadales bacterium]
EGEAAARPSRRRTRPYRPRPGRIRPIAPEDPHYRVAMELARRMGRTAHRDRAGRLICHHLRCMLA